MQLLFHFIFLFKGVTTNLDTLNCELEPNELSTEKNKISEKLMHNDECSDVIQLFKSLHLKTFPDKLSSLSETSAYVQVRTEAKMEMEAIVKKSSLCWLMMKEKPQKVSNDRLFRVRPK